MKVQRNGSRGVIEQAYCIFLIYDETSVFDEAAEDRKRLEYNLSAMPIAPNVNPGEFKDNIIKKIIQSKKRMDKSYGHPHVCYFSINKNSAIMFEFDAHKLYTVEELKKIIQLANAAKRRCKFA